MRNILARKFANQTVLSKSVGIRIEILIQTVCLFNGDFKPIFCQSKDRNNEKC